MQKQEGTLTRAQERRMRERVRRSLDGRSAATELLCQMTHFGGAMAMKYLRPYRSMGDLMEDQDRAAYKQLLQREREILLRLQKRKLVEIRRQGNDLEAVLTHWGREAVLREEIRQCGRMLPEGEYCVVAYDIAQHAKLQRELFRGFLKSVGFQRLQMSVWYTERDVVRPLLLLLELANHPFSVSVFKGKLFSPHFLCPGKESVEV